MCSHKNKRAHSACPGPNNDCTPRRRNRWLLILWPLGGLICLVWFLIRVIPKPSRATYPCQRVAMPIATSFVVWVVGLTGAGLVCRKARALLTQSRYALGCGLLAIAVATCWITINIASDRRAAAAFTPSDPPNTPVGQAKGIYPGRVTWVCDPDATSWDESNGSWWDDNNTSQVHVDRMISRTLRTLTGRPDDASAWDALFRHFNQTRGLGDIGYQSPEKIAIKINMNQMRTVRRWNPYEGMPSPHVVDSVVRQLVEVVGAPGSAITIYDASRYIGDPIYDRIRSNPGADYQAIRFVVKPNVATNGRLAAVRDTDNPVYTERAEVGYLPRCVTGAKYLINMALLRAHSIYGVTLCAKNHFGSTYFESRNDWTPSPLHDYGNKYRSMGSRNCLVDLNGHEHLAGKTMLHMIDALYSATNQGGRVIPFISFNNDWCSSIFASQDPVAIDSVGLDFLRHEDSLNSSINDVTGTPDNYLHEMALADNPPSGTNYDPENDGSRLSSLGVHEHWNNPQLKQYTRNLGTGDGIELVQVQPGPDADFDDDGIVNTKDFAMLAAYWRDMESSVDIAPVFLGDGWVGLDDLNMLLGYWLEDFSLAAYWTMDQTTGGTAIDSSVHGRDGTLLNMNNSAWVTGKVGNALEFDGVNDTVQVVGWKGLTAGRSRTCAAWINTSTPNGVVVGWGAAGAVGGRWILAVDGAGLLRLEVGGGAIVGTQNVCDGAWRHVAAVVEDNGAPNLQDVVLYVDGAEEPLSTPPANRKIDTSPWPDVTIGQWSLGRYFKGLIDEVQIYTRALTAEEIAQLAP